MLDENNSIKMEENESASFSLKFYENVQLFAIILFGTQIAFRTFYILKERRISVADGASARDNKSLLQSVGKE